MPLNRILRLALLGAGLMPTAACADLLTNPLLESGQVPLTATPVPLSTNEPGRAEVGALVYLGGVELTGRGTGFGGISALAVAADGERFLALSDIGFWVTGRLEFDAAGRLVGADAAEAGRLRQLDGEEVGRMFRDAEALAVAADSGSAIVGFERQHRLWRYAIDDAGGLDSVPVPVATPPGIEAAPSNGGIEALALLADGRHVAFAEGLADDDGSLAWVGSGTDGAVDWLPLRYVAAPGYAVSDAAGLPGGGLLVLERAFAVLAGARARLVYVPAEALTAGTPVAGRELALLAPPLTVDNFEALAVVPEPDGAVKLILGSDDNFRPFQRTLLLAFRWRQE